MERLFFFLGALLGLFGVASGAFGSHLLRDQIASLNTFEIAVRYQMHHALALMGTAWLTSRSRNVFGNLAGWLFFAGTVLFSGSLYVLALSGQRALVMITPIGGTALLGGWVCLVLAALLHADIGGKGGTRS